MIIGQEHIIEDLKKHIASNVNRNKPLEHAVFYGPPGLGKTTFSQYCAKQSSVNYIQKTGRELTLQIAKKIIHNINYGSVFFIDEIHRVNVDVTEALYGPMQDILNFHKDYLKTKYFPRQFEWEGKVINPFCLIGATTTLGSLPQPLINRFVHKYRLTYYKENELKQILEASGCSSQAAKIIAQRSKGTPRTAIGFLLNLSNYGYNIDELTEKQCVEFFDNHQIDNIGLEPIDYSILEILSSGIPIGQGTICSSIGIDINDLSTINEPYLLNLGLIRVSKGGRVITDKGKEFIQGIRKGYQNDN